MFGKTEHLLIVPGGKKRNMPPIMLSQAVSCILEVSGSIPVRALAVSQLTEVYHNFPRPIQTNARTVP